MPKCNLNTGSAAERSQPFSTQFRYPLAGSQNLEQSLAGSPTSVICIFTTLASAMQCRPHSGLGRAAALFACEGTYQFSGGKSVSEGIHQRLPLNEDIASFKGIQNCKKSWVTTTCAPAVLDVLFKRCCRNSGRCDSRLRSHYF